MSDTILNLAAHLISLQRLAIALIPVAAVLLILNAWSLAVKTSLLAMSRMLLQLLLLGYVLVYIFESETPWIVLLVLTGMLMAASWISLRVSVKHRRRMLSRVLFSVTVGGGLTLLIITQGVLQLDPWYEPRSLIPLAGMIFSNCMNSISLAVERFYAERSRGVEYTAARRTGLEAALIPITNSLFAVGLVSIPGMMTGQVLAGVEPLIAARYQIMVMCMMFASSGLSASLCLSLIERDTKTNRQCEELDQENN
jgi:putative ABC transport system permease protein